MVRPRVNYKSHTTVSLLRDGWRQDPAAVAGGSAGRRSEGGGAAEGGPWGGYPRASSSGPWRNIFGGFDR